MRLLPRWIALTLVLAPVSHVLAAPSETEALRAQLAELRKTASGSIPEGAFESIAYQLDIAERIEGSYQPQSVAWRQRAERFLKLAREGTDPIVAQHGKILMRGYQSPISLERQGYAIYIPPEYDPAKRYPMLIALHGGSANGNLFLGVVLGNNMNWKQYPKHLWDEYEPRWSPDWIVVAPDGFGQVMWRWMGEQDVLDVIDDVQKHYSVDPDRIVFSGLSNGGVGAYTIGMRHAWRFAAVLAIAGAPSWLQYAGGSQSALDQTLLHPVSGMSLVENAINTDFRYYHGRTDTGPMRPAYVEELGRVIRETGVPFQEKWYDMGHDLLYVVHRHGKIYEQLADVRRKRRPKEVRVVTGDYRANRQHWVTVTRFERYPELARVRAVAKDAAIDVETSNTRALALHLHEAPVANDGKLTIRIDGNEAYAGPRAALGHIIHLVRDATGWRTGFPDDGDRLAKRPGSMGPITDAYFGGLLHVYGTANPEHTDALREAAERGAKGWPLWLWRVKQKVLADTEVTDELMRSHHVVLYATSGSNKLLERMKGKLPVTIAPDAVVLGGKRFEQKGVGVKLIYPNPIAPERYVIVQGAPTPAAVAAGHNLPDFLPDYVVYDAASTKTRPRLLFPKRAGPPAQGFFGPDWKLPPAARPAARPAAQPAAQPGEGGGEPPGPDAGARADAAMPLLPIPPSPKRPARPKRFTASADTPTGIAAREIARRARSFPNFRGQTPGGRWQVEPKSMWSIRNQDECTAALRNASIRATPWRMPLTTPVPSPVELTSRVEGVWFRMAHAERPLLVACEMAARLPALARILKRHGVRGVDVMSSYRETPRSSFHTFGLALDLFRFWTLKDAWSVERDFRETPAQRTCDAPRTGSRAARALLDIACRAADHFSTVLTPNYNEGHRDHFHLDIRPDDPRRFVR
jgi:predicted esterase